MPPRCEAKFDRVARQAMPLRKKKRPQSWRDEGRDIILVDVVRNAPVAVCKVGAYAGRIWTGVEVETR